MGAGGEAGRREARLVAEVTELLARFVARSRWDDLAPGVRHEAKRGLLNFAGCLLSGRREPELRMLREALPGEDALADAAAATALDYDDTHLRTVIHATPPVGAVVFALARRRAVPGPALLHAFALGVEVSCRMGNAVTPGHYERGWHITSTCGVFGAAMACAKILNLDEAQVRSCLGLAATQSSGLVEMLGSMARVLNAGVAARNGLAAALLAEQGFEGPARPLEGLRGFFNVFGGSRDFDAIARDLGRRWELSGLAYKPYPSGVVLHALIDGCLELRRKGAMPERLSLRMHPLAIERTDRPEPRNAIEARLSAQHAAAVVFLRVRAGLEEFSDAAAVDPEIAAMRRRVSVAPDESLDKMAAVIGEGSGRLVVPAARRLDDARLEAKFREQAGAEAEPWVRFIASLESRDTVALPG